MNITIYISGVTGGGAEKVSCSLASYLVNKGHTVELLTMSDEKETYPLDKRVSRFCLLKEKERKNRIYNNLLRLYRFVKYLLKQKPDVYLAMLPTNIHTLLLFKSLTYSKIIAAERANPSSYIQQTQQKLIKIAHKADGWVFQTKEQMRWYESKCSLNKRIIIPNAINPDILAVKRKKETMNVIVSSGRLIEQKNHLLLIDAFSRISYKYKELTLVIYGEGPNRNVLSKRIQELKLKDRVFLPGYTSDIVNKIKDASLFVLSSNYEGMPNALMEAMALGVPSIATDCDGGGARYLIEDGKNGLLVPTKDVEKLADAMDFVLSNPDMAQSLGKEAQKLCKSLAPEKVYSYWEEFLEEIILM